MAVYHWHPDKHLGRQDQLNRPFRRSGLGSLAVRTAKVGLFAARLEAQRLVHEGSWERACWRGRILENEAVWHY